MLFRSATETIGPAAPLIAAGSPQAGRTTHALRPALILQSVHRSAGGRVLGARAMQATPTMKRRNADRRSRMMPGQPNSPHVPTTISASRSSANTRVTSGQSRELLSTTPRPWTDISLQKQVLGSGQWSKWACLPPATSFWSLPGLRGALSGRTAPRSRRSTTHCGCDT